MLEKLKWYLVEIGIKKYAPMGIAAGCMALGGYMTAHAGVLEQYGITYGIWPIQWSPDGVPSGAVIIVELETFKVWAYTAIVALAGVACRAAQHHTTGTTVVPGGMRESDPPAPTTQGEQK